MTDPQRSARVIAVHRVLAAAAVPHAIGGAIALGIYAAPRETIDIDVNVFVHVEGRPEVRLEWDSSPVHLFFSEDALHDAMPAAVRRVPFPGSTIPIVSPEHLIVRKAMLGRPKDWLDIEAILVGGEPLDLEEIRSWLRRLAPERLSVFETSAMAK